MTRTILALLLVGGLLSGLASAGSAYFTDSKDVTANSFTTGTVIIGVSPAATLVTYSNMAPGDKKTAPLTVSNSGSLELRYAMTTAISGETNGLGTQLELQVKTGVTACTDGGFDTDGTSIYNIKLTGAAIGNPAQGNQSGDRSLAASVNEVLCFQARLPFSTGNTYQNSTATATFTFAAEQTANNP